MIGQRGIGRVASAWPEKATEAVSAPSGNNMNVKMWYRLRDYGVDDGENSVRVVGQHRCSRDLLGSHHDHRGKLRRGHQQAFDVHDWHYEGVSEEDGCVVEQRRRVSSYVDDAQVVWPCDQIAEGTHHG